jgi:thiol:disulfide interchange protein DsbC
MTVRIWTSIFCLAAGLSALSSTPAMPFAPEGRADGDCVDCHSLTQDEARERLKRLISAGQVDRVVEVRTSGVPGLYEVAIEKQKRKYPLYLDFSKRYLIVGNVIELETMENLAKEREIDLNRVDPSVIPLNDAVVIGDPEAETKIVVFDDPECPYCVKLHPEMKATVEKRKDVAFFIKMLPLKIHPSARDKAKAIVCAKSAQLLEASLAGKPIPEPSCETDQIEKNEALAAELGVRSTPTLVFPDGRVVPGYRSAQKILAYLGNTEVSSGE